METNDDDDFWNWKAKSAEQLKVNEKKPSLNSSNEDINNNEQDSSREGKKKDRDEDNTKDRIEKQPRTNENDRNQEKNAEMYEKLFQNLERLKPKRFTESSAQEDEESFIHSRAENDDPPSYRDSVRLDESDIGERNDKNETMSESELRGNSSNRPKSGDKKENQFEKYDDDFSSNEDNSRHESENSSDSSTRRRRQKEQDTFSDHERDEESLKKNHDHQKGRKFDDHQDQKTSEDEENSDKEEIHRIRRKKSKNRKEPEAKHRLSSPDSDKSSLGIQTKHRSQESDRSTSEEVCKWIKEKKEIAGRKRLEELKKKYEGENNVNSSPKRSKKRPINGQRRIRSSSEPGEERSKVSSGALYRSRSHSRIPKELRSGEFDWSQSNNDEIRLWLKEKNRLLKKKREEERKKKKLERKEKEEKVKQRQEKFSDSFERVSDWLKQKMEQERLLRRKKRNEEKESQDLHSANRMSTEHHPYNHLNPGFVFQSKAHPLKAQEATLLKQREKQKQTMLRNTLKHHLANKSIGELGRNGEQQQTLNKMNFEKLQDTSDNSNLPSPSRTRSATRLAEQNPLRQSVSLSRITIPSENEKGNPEPAKLRKTITFEEWLKKKNTDELRKPMLPKKKLDADLKELQKSVEVKQANILSERKSAPVLSARKTLELTANTSKAGNDKQDNLSNTTPALNFTRSRPGTSRSDRPKSGRISRTMENPHTTAKENAVDSKSAMEVRGTVLRAKSPKFPGAVRPQVGAVKYQKDSWEGFSDYLWNQVNEQEDGELQKSQDKTRSQTTVVEKKKPKDDLKIEKDENKIKKTENIFSLFEDTEEKTLNSNEMRAKGHEHVGTWKLEKVETLPQARMHGETKRTTADIKATDSTKSFPDAEEDLRHRNSSPEVTTLLVSSTNNGFHQNSYAPRSKIHTIIDADDEDPEMPDSENTRPYSVMRNGSNSSDIEEDVASDYE